MSDFCIRSENCGRFVKWRTKIGARIDPNSVVAVLEVDGCKVSLRSSCFGLVASFSDDVKEGDQIDKGRTLVMVTPCEHPVVMKDMCGYCGQDLRMKDGFPGERHTETRANTAMIHSLPELLITENEAKVQGAADEKNLLNSRKLVLLVDLDQTLIHTTNEQVDPKLKDVKHFQLYGLRSYWYHTKLRPHAKEFLQKLKDIFELHICSFGVRLYAHTVANLLDDSGELFRHRILSRDECFDPNLKTANLKALFPCGDHLVCIIDDREDVWSFAKNVIHVKPYRYFKHTGDINAPPGFRKTDENTEQQKCHQFTQPSSSAESQNQERENLVETKTSPDSEREQNSDQAEQLPEGNSEGKPEKELLNAAHDSECVSTELIEEDKDDYLCCLENILRRVHTAFYQSYDELCETGSKQIPDDHPIGNVKRKVLTGKRIVFSGLIPTNQKMEFSNIYKLAISFGAVVQKQIVTKEMAATKSEQEGNTNCCATTEMVTTHLIAAKWGTSKVHSAARSGYVKIVSADWFWSCVERWEAPNESLFPLAPDETSDGGVRPTDRPLTPSIDLEKDSMDTALSVTGWPLSQEQLRRMSDEVDDALSDEDEPPNETEQNGNESTSSEGIVLKLRDTPFVKMTLEDSLSGRIPKGWKRKSKDLQLNQDLEETDSVGRKFPRKADEEESGGEDFDDDDEGDSVGSVDDEMVAALEREMNEDW